MAIPANIDQLIKERTVERCRIEYKEGWDPKPIIHTICAFANDYEGYCGGYVLVGVKAENGIPVLPVKGLLKEELDHIQGEVIEFCKKSFDPPYLPSMEPMELDGKNVLVIWCPNGYDAPYYARVDPFGKDSKNVKCYIRKGSSTLKASPTEIKEIQRGCEIVPFDDRANFKADIGEIRFGLVSDYLSYVKSDLLTSLEERGPRGVYESLQLLAGPREALHPKNAALLMFSMEPERFVPYSYIVVDYIPDPAGDGLETKTFRGPVQKQLSDALLYIRNQYLKTRIIKTPGQAESVTIENYPYEALQELLPNAVLHKDYQIPEPITVRITSDRIEITSFPGISPAISDEKIASFNMVSRSYRNKRLAMFLRELDLIEAKNTGIPKARRSLSRNGSPDLKIEMGPEREYVVFSLLIHPDFVTPLSEVRQTGSVAERILFYLAKNPSSTETQIARGLGYNRISNSLHRALHSLLDSGKLRRTGLKYDLKHP